MKYILEGTEFIVGKNAEDNWKIILEAEKDYYWVHADNIPSAHVIIHIDKPIQQELDYACQLCKKHTKITKSTKFVITQINNLKLGSVYGQVYYKDISKCSYITI
jgi:predicted ribosome quality control (RQC) complex YloA/Tae2 family protein